MRKTDLDGILNAMIEAHAGVSDCLFIVGRPLQVEAFGELKPVMLPNAEIHRLSTYQLEQIVLIIIGEDRRLLHDLFTSGSCDCSYVLSEQLRFRVNIFRQKGQFGIVMRKPQWEIPTLLSLALPPIFQEMVREKTGLILCTGATGSGKTTTLAAMLNEINERYPVHVVTLEDPIEFVHQHKRATFSQRELGLDFDDYANGLRAALRQAPKVILVGEMRDRRTVEIALTAAETGHLVLSTLHTVDAGQTINRIVGMFDRSEEAQLRQRLAETLRYVVSQRLAPRRTGGRILLLEIMGSNLRTREAVAFGENESRTFYDIIDSSVSFGWTTFDRSIARAFEAGLITEEVAYLYSTHKGRITRMLDEIKKRRGIAQEDGTSLRLDLPNQPAAPPASARR